MSTPSLQTLLDTGAVQSQLAAAAYATLSTGPILVKDLTAANMSSSDADAFAATYTVVAQYTDQLTGLSATVFYNTDTGETNLAIRGTVPYLPQNWLQDALLAGGVPASAIPGYSSLQAQVQTWMNQDPPILPDQFTVAGHSLGGYLAAALQNDFPDNITQGYGLNAPGTGGPIGTILSFIGLNNNLNSNFTVYQSEDGPTAPITGLGWPLGATIVDINSGLSHSINALATSLTEAAATDGASSNGATVTQNNLTTKESTTTDEYGNTVITWATNTNVVVGIQTIYNSPNDPGYDPNATAFPWSGTFTNPNTGLFFMINVLADGSNSQTLTNGSASVTVVTDASGNITSQTSNNDIIQGLLNDGNVFDINSGTLSSTLNNSNGSTTTMTYNLNFRSSKFMASTSHN